MYEFDIRGNATKRPYTLPAASMKRVELEGRAGYHEMAAPGQILNPRKMYKRSLNKPVNTQ